LRVKPEDMAAIRKAVGTKTHDLKLPAKIGQSQTTQRALSAKLGPDEWIILADHAQAAALAKTFAALAKKFTISATDVSHRNIGLRITGPEAAATINIGCPLDLSVSAFPIGKATRTVFENAPILLLREDETTFRLESWRSFTPYIVGFFVRFAGEL